MLEGNAESKLLSQIFRKSPACVREQLRISHELNVQGVEEFVQKFKESHSGLLK